MNQAVSQTELKQELAILLEEQFHRQKYNKIRVFFPDTGPYRRELYPKHLDFMFAGAQYPQRAFIAANRVGKTIAGAYECTLHLTGDYPAWWKGKKFRKPIEAWAAAPSNELVTTICQKELIGDLYDPGTGLIPKDCIVEDSIVRKAGVPGAIDSIKVRHKTGGYSKLYFKSYDQGRAKFQGTKKQFIWLDEEPEDPGIFSECVTRTAGGGSDDDGIILCTFTPLFGLSDVVLRFLKEGRVPVDGINPDNRFCYTVNVTWEDVPHLSDSWKEQAESSYSPHEREARQKGIPSLGAGAIYPVPESDFVVSPFNIPDFWPKAYGLDVGWNKTAGVWAAIDPQTKVIYLYSEHYVGEQQPALHASAIKARGEWLWGAVDPRSDSRNQVDGTRLLDLYQEQGLNIAPADNSVEAGILAVYQGLSSGQIKVFTNLTNWIAEFRVYRRDEKGKIVKKNDHLMDATRYLIMTGLSLATVEPEEDEYNEISSSGRNSITGY